MGLNDKCQFRDVVREFVSFDQFFLRVMLNPTDPNNVCISDINFLNFMCFSPGMVQFP